MPKSKPKSQEKKPKPAKMRQIKKPAYKSFHISKRIKIPKPKLTGSFRLFYRAIKLLVKKYRLFGGITLVYLFLTVILVKGFGFTSNIAQLNSSIERLLNGGMTNLLAGVSVFSLMLSNANSTSSDVAGAYQSMILIVVSLVMIWALRHTLADKPVKVSVRDSFYKGLTPIIPFLLVLLVIGLQLVPVVISNFLYGLVFTGGLAVTAPEQWLWGVLLALLVLLSLYMITSSIFALYIVTLPNIRPMQALRSARDVVRHRRWLIMRKVLFLPLALMVCAAVIVIPIIIMSPAVAEWVFFGLSMLALAIAHSYFYMLYRELLK